MGFLLRWLLLSLLAVGRQQANAFSIRSAAEELEDEKVPVLGNQTEPLSFDAKNESSWNMEIYGSGESPLEENEPQEEGCKSQQQEHRPQPRCPPCKSPSTKLDKCPFKLPICSPRQLQEMNLRGCPPDLPNCDPEKMSVAELRGCPPDLPNCDPEKLPVGEPRSFSPDLPNCDPNKHLVAESRSCPPGLASCEPKVSEPHVCPPHLHTCLLKQPNRLKVTRKPLCSPDHPLCQPKRPGYPPKRQPYYVFTSKRPQQYVHPSKWRQPHTPLYRRSKRPKPPSYSIHWPKQHGYPNRPQLPSYQMVRPS